MTWTIGNDGVAAYHDGVAACHLVEVRGASAARAVAVGLHTVIARPLTSIVPVPRPTEAIFAEMVHPSLIGIVFL